jgi:dolichol-phosphate mannosyltransferase
MKKDSTLVIIPTYNERENIRALLPRVLAAVPGGHVLVVDDGSPDGTAAEVKAAARRSRGRVHVLERAGKQGLGTAYVAGFRWGLAKGYGRLVQMDADFSHDPAALPELLRALDGADVVVGTRYSGGKISVVNWPLQRLALSMGASVYVRLVTGLPLSDCTGGFKAWRAEALRGVALEQVRSDGYSFQIEMNYKAWKKGFRLAERPIVFVDRSEGQSKMNGGIVREAIWRVWALRLGL